MDPLPFPRGVPPAPRRPDFTGRSRARREAETPPIPTPCVCNERQRFAEELERAKLDAMKELAYGASHEINNPLANIALRMQTLLKREDDPEKRKLLEAAHRSAMRAHEMISDLMLFARPPAPERTRVRLVEVLDRVVEEMGAAAEAADVSVTRRPGGEDAVAWADPVQVAVAVQALVENAVEAIGRGGAPGAVAVSAGCAGDDRAVVEVCDDGPGVDEAIRPHVFDPFFSGREAGRGLGFGLSKCWRIATAHGGDVRLENASPSGVRVTVTLPAAPPERLC